MGADIEKASTTCGDTHRPAAVGSIRRDRARGWELGRLKVAGMMVFTWLTLVGIERLRLEFTERYESGILVTVLIFLCVGIAYFGF